MWREAKRVIQHGRRFLLTTHLNPDGDGIGSAVALMELLLHQGKHSVFISDSPLPPKYAFLDFHGKFQSYLPEEDDLSSFDTLIVLDTSRKERIGRVADLTERSGLTTLWIDHHPTQETPSPHKIIDASACSVGSMIYSLFKECGYELNLHAAMGIYTSVISDTGRFSYGSTTRKAHKLADECLKVGINPSEMYARLFQQVPLEQITIFQRALKRMEFHCQNKIVLQQVRFGDYSDFCSEGDLSLIQDFDAIHEFNKSIRGIQCAVILWELPDQSVRISLRSNSNLDIVAPMRKLGGGGHPNAAGALLNLPFEESKEKVLNLLRDLLNQTLFL